MGQGSLRATHPSHVQRSGQVHNACARTARTAQSTHLVHREDLASRALHLAVLVQEVPEARLGHNLVLGEHTHPVDLRVRVVLRRLAPAHNLILTKLVRAHREAPSHKSVATTCVRVRDNELVGSG